MPPTRGHDLKLAYKYLSKGWNVDAPHTGARLETQATPDAEYALKDAPHTGARLETLRIQSRPKN